MSDWQTLTVALAHLAPQRGRSPMNLATLRSAVSSAAAAGADLVVGPELSVAGYGFTDPTEAAALAEPLLGPTVQALTEDCGRLRIVVVAGILERAADGNTLHNTAVVVDAKGLLGVHRKQVIAERAWATAGESGTTTVDVPFGRLGILVCADTYYAGPARACALAGADLLVVPSAWPADDMDPVDIWRERARQNGLPLLACNRTGIDGQFDARTAPTAVVTPDGTVATRHVGDEESIVFAQLPLVDGWIAQQREAALAGRDPTLWQEALRAPAANRPDGSSAGTPSVTIHVVTDPTAGGGPRDLIVLPAGYPPRSVDGSLVLGCDDQGTWAADRVGIRRRTRAALAVTQGSWRVGVLSAAEAHHPEAVIGLVRSGCDIVAVSAARPIADDVRRFGVAALDRAVIAVAAPGRALLAIPPLACEAAAVRATSAAGGIDDEVDLLPWSTQPPADGLDRGAP